jgi:beta-N-acetylhexosaminidase
MDQRPASLSPVMVDDLLRDQMGYQGVVITDDLTMGAIVENYSLAEAGILAIEAGCDLLPVCHGTDRLREVQAALLSAVRSGRLSEDRIDQSVRRILLLKRKIVRHG